VGSGSRDLHSKHNQRKSKQKQWLKSRKADGLVIKGLQRAVWCRDGIAPCLYRALIGFGFFFVTSIQSVAIKTRFLDMRGILEPSCRIHS